ncbi:translocation/assembly module TamB domain-containing protein [Pelomonas sp. SE-A7]|uniref:translocation/assembly module TamB domain-containing protein n=1 Tax=Pelomonas sp. SE-A7 TaxID=3054953 RepID=UPI00259CC057|nr:translocation/assembly module TamB domain-containing protein [Pelomonas sp. SE-A7]MDM4767352.1 translocation/assembly module TamB domain-containing protein [Pelomonas sp. SE-A7]
MKRGHRWSLLLAVPAVALSLAAGTALLLKTEAGTAWLLRHLPGVEVQAPQGPLLGSFSARHVSLDIPGGDRLLIQGLRWQDLALDLFPLKLATPLLAADKLEYRSAPTAKPKPLQAPTDLHLPLAVEVDKLELAELIVPGLEKQPLRQLQASVTLNGRHEIKLRRLKWDRLQMEGQLHLGADAPLLLQATLKLQDDGSLGRPWDAHLQLSGQLSEIAVQAGLRAEAQAMQVQARVQPFAAWPLASLQAQVDSLDLAALYSQAPHTRLTGKAELKSIGWQQPAQLQLQLSNPQAGRWDRERLPIRQLQASLQANPEHPELWHLQSLDLDLGSAGRVTAQGRQAAEQRWQVEARVAELRLAELDGRLAPLRLSGPLKLQGQGLTGKRSLQAQLEGRLESRPATPLQVRLALDSQDQHLQLRQLLLESGTAKLQATAELDLAERWRASGQATVQALDPRLLWAGQAGSAWQRGEHGLNAEARFDLRAPASSASRWPLGTANLQLLPSKLQGQALQGEASYLGEADSRLQASFASGENRLQLSADPTGARAELKAPQLASLAPLLSLWQIKLAGAAEGKLQTRLDAALKPVAATVELQGRDLVVASPGSKDWKATRLNVSGELASALDAPLRLQVQLDGLGQGQGHMLGRGLLDLQGSWARHQARIELDAQLALNPTLQSLLAEGPTLPSQLRSSLQGGFDQTPLAAGDHALRWQARFSELLARPARPQAQPWLSGKDLGLALDFDAGLFVGPSRFSLLPGRAEIGGAALAWQSGRWQAARQQAEPGQLQADLKLEPLAIAPLLKRWQPDFGWGGDLVVAGRLQLRATPQVELDIELQRERGDLSVTDERGPQQLGLSALRLALQARDGRWQLQQQFEGSSLGRLSATASAKAEPLDLIPGPKSPLDGKLQADVANLGLWGRWVPPGWRVGGQLEAGMQLAGTLQAPQLIGQVQGRRLSLRNPLLGVDVRDTEFLLKLNGENAQLERLLARGPEGLLTASGTAQLGEKPQASLQLKAEGLTLLNRVDRRAQISGEAKLALAEQSLELDGSLRLDSALFDFSRGDAPTLDDDVTVVRPQQQAAPPTPVAPAKQRRVRVDMQLDMGEKLQLRGRGFESRLVGQLKLSQRDASIRLNGILRTEGGTYAAYGQKLEIEKGELIFTGPYDNPRLDVLALRPNTDVQVGVALGGTAISPRIKLYSDPEMSDTDKLSWLLLGRAPEGLGRADTAVLQRAALALLSGEGESPSGRLMKNLGLDELSLSQNEEDSRGTVVRLGKQLSRRWYVGYERGLNATSGSWQLIYRIAQRFTLRAQSGDENALDLIWQWRWK